MHSLHLITPLLLSVAHGFPGRFGKRHSIANLDSRDEFISFSRFLNQASAATYKDYANTAIRDADAFAELKAHIKEMYGGVLDPSSIASYILDGEYVDCIPFVQQPTIHVLKLTPAQLLPPEDIQTPNLTVPDGEPQYALPGPLPGSTDTFGHPTECTNKTTVPIYRLSLERLTLFPDLYTFFSNPETPLLDNSTQTQQRRDVTPGPDGVKHLFVTGRDSRTPPHHYFGARAAINIWSPVAMFSGSQFWLTVDRPVLQTVTTGWLVRSATGTKARFTVGYRSGPTTGCYNVECPGFIKDPAGPPVGSLFSHYSSPGASNQWEFTPLFEQSAAAWSLYYVFPNGRRQRVGYYPHTLFERTSGSLSWGADRVNFGGHVADVGKHNVFGQMGSGRHAATRFGSAAYQRAIQVYSAASGSLKTWRDGVLVPQNDDRAGCYSYKIEYLPSPWRTTFWFGGPGGKNCDQASP